jgi:CheY-like chemotaxis protein
VNNAIKFTPTGSITIKVHCSDQVEGNVTIHLSVQDTGIGMSEKVMEKVFDAFTQADGSTTRKYGGTGLGLAICRRLSELMGGRIWTESSEGKGSTFYVDLPMQYRALGEAPQSKPHLPELNRTGKAMSLLIAEDNAINADMLTRILQRMGHSVVVVEDGAKAVQQWRERIFDAVLMDIQMPGMSGDEALREIRLQEKGTGRRTPVIAVTAYALPNEQKRYLESGFDDYVTKPVAAHRLAEILEKMGAS